MGKAVPAPAAESRRSLPGRVVLPAFVGRREELTALGRRLREHRLVSIVGPGGIGKTRLAQALAGESARRFPDGVWLVELTHVTRSELLAAALADALGIGDAADPLLDAAAWLADRQALLIFDECEPLAADLGPLIEQLLSRCERLTVLTTTREPLAIAGEFRWSLAPMATPEPGETAANRLLATDAVALFHDRARRARPDWELTPELAPTVAEIVRRLDGIPLAIELAAAWMSALAPADVLARLDRRFELLVNRERAPHRRHASLLAAIESTYQGVDAGSQTLFRRLGVFAGDWTLASMLAVSGLLEPEALAALAALVERSLVVARPAGPGSGRYAMLETVRDFAREKLREAGEEPAAQERLVAYVTALVASNPSPEELDAEQANLRAVLDRPPDGDVALALTAGVMDYWELRGRYVESRLRLARAAELAPAPTPALARVLSQLGFVLFVQGDAGSAAAALRRALAVARAAGDRNSAVVARNHLSLLALVAGRLRAARWWAERALATVPPGDAALVAQAHLRLGEVQRAEGNLAGARRELTRAVAAAERGQRGPESQVAKVNLARIDIAEREWGAADARLKSVLSDRGPTPRPRALAGVMEAMAAVAAAGGDRRRAARLAGIAAGIVEQAELVGPVTSYSEMFEGAIAGPGGNREYAIGRRMDLASAIRFALGEETAAEARAPARRPKTVRPAVPLTKRQLAVARMVARGLSNKDIAQELWISERTAEGHVEQIRNKLGAGSRVQVAAWFVANFPDEGNAGRG